VVKKSCRAAGIDPDRRGGRGIGIHSLRKTAINDAIRNGATLWGGRVSGGRVSGGRVSGGRVSGGRVSDRGAASCSSPDRRLFWSTLPWHTDRLLAGQFHPSSPAR
jgi:hypothetical protein